MRALETRHIERLGDSREVCVDARGIAATNQNMDDLVTDGAFREDLGAAAKLLGVNRMTVWNRMRKYGLHLEKKVSERHR